jgi:PPP family 3-phenylpropionic acid transporter
MVVGAHLVPRELARASPIPSPLRRLSLADAFDLLRAPLFLLFVLAASLIQSSHALYYSFGSLNWRAQGVSDGVIGALWSVGVVAEVALFAISGRVIRFAARRGCSCSQGSQQPCAGGSWRSTRRYGRPRCCTP